MASPRLTAPGPIRIEGLEGVLKTLQQLPPEIVSARGGPVRTAMRKASALVVKRMQSNVQQIIDAPNADGRASKSTGLLKKNIITRRETRKMNVNGERYVVTVRRKYYPQNRMGKRTFSTYTVGLLLEIGTKRRRPMPWFTPAWKASEAEARSMFAAELNRQIARIEKRLAAKNRVS